MKTKPNQLLLSGLIGLCGIAGLYVSPLLYLLPALMAFTLCFPAGCTLLALAIATAGTALLSGAEWMYGLAYFLPATAVLVLCVRKKLSYRGAVMGASACFAIARYMDICLPSLLAGKDAFALMREVMTQITASVVSMAEATGHPIPAQTAALVVDFTPQFTVLMVLLPALLFGFADVLLARFLCLRGGMELRPMAKMRHWQLSTDDLIGAGILTAGAIAVRVMALRYAGAIIWAIELILLAEFALNGLCYTVFTNQVIRRRSTTGCVVQYLLYALFLPYSLFMLAILGLAECLLKLRRRYDAGMRQGGPED